MVPHSVNDENEYLMLKNTAVMETKEVDEEQKILLEGRLLSFGSNPVKDIDTGILLDCLERDVSLRLSFDDQDLDPSSVIAIYRAFPNRIVV